IKEARAPKRFLGIATAGTCHPKACSVENASRASTLFLIIFRIHKAAAKNEVIIIFRDLVPAPPPARHLGLPGRLVRPVLLALLIMDSEVERRQIAQGLGIKPHQRISPR